MANSIYLINPKANFANYYSADVMASLNLSPTAYVADLAIATVAALVPDDFTITLCDEHITPVDFDYPARFIALTGKNSQFERMVEIAQEFRQRGKIVLIGGSYASLVPDMVRPHCDILVRGEIEMIAPQLFSDLKNETWEKEYIGGQPDLRHSPIPRWDLYPNDQSLLGCVQTSRGCPFECEFCDVIQYVGRKQRHKSIEQILTELDILYEHGYRMIFIADDNFTVYRRRTRELLVALRDWNNRQAEGRVIFSTQLSIDIARDDDILRLCAEAGICYVFIGIETPNEESLKEARKRQNVGIDIGAQIQRFLEHGIVVMGGMIVGFDADGPDIFEQQYRFAMSIPVPMFMLGALVAPEATPLFERMQRDNRLAIPQYALQKNSANHTSIALPWVTNVIPKQMTQAELLDGIRWLANRLYDPQAFGERVSNMISCYQAPPLAHLHHRPYNRPVELNMVKVLQSLYRLGKAEARMMSKITRVAAKKPSLQGVVIQILFQYAQIRYMYEQGQFWEPHLVQYPGTERETKIELEVLSA
jgi:radical SAM superfamily enzyme YgiQ (UPF0313 family)